MWFEKKPVESRPISLSWNLSNVSNDIQFEGFKSPIRSIGKSKWKFENQSGSVMKENES